MLECRCLLSFLPMAPRNNWLQHEIGLARCYIFLPHDCMCIGKSGANPQKMVGSSVMDNRPCCNQISSKLLGGIYRFLNSCRLQLAFERAEDARYCSWVSLCFPYHRYLERTVCLTMLTTLFNCPKPVARPRRRPPPACSIEEEKIAAILLVLAHKLFPQQ